MLVLARVATLSVTPLSNAVCESATPWPIEPSTWPKVGATACSWPLTSAPRELVAAPTGAPLATARAPASVVVLYAAFRGAGTTPVLRADGPEVVATVGVRRSRVAAFLAAALRVGAALVARRVVACVMICPSL